MQVCTLFIALYSKYKRLHLVEGDREAIACHPGKQVPSGSSRVGGIDATA